MATVVFAAESEKSNPFVSGSFQQIVDSREGRPFLLVMWSLDCASCRKELDMLAVTRLKNPAMDIVMIATDEEPDPDSVSQMLEEHHMQGIESWFFSDSNLQKLRYEVDPTWYGEIPRTYFYDSNHLRIAISGVLEAGHLETWLSTRTQ